MKMVNVNKILNGRERKKALLYTMQVELIITALLRMEIVLISPQTCLVYDFLKLECKDKL